MSLITWWRNRRPFTRRVIGLLVLLWMLVLFFLGLIYTVGIPARRVVIWTSVVIWFFHVFIGAGAGFAAWRLWPDRDNPFIRRVIIALHQSIIGALWAICLLFLSRDVRLTWKFSIVLFGGTAIMDCVTLPLLLYIIRGPRLEKTDTPNRSGDKPPEYWEDRFDRIEAKLDERR